MISVEEYYFGLIKSWEVNTDETFYTILIDITGNVIDRPKLIHEREILDILIHDYFRLS